MNIEKGFWSVECSMNLFVWLDVRLGLLIVAISFGGGVNGDRGGGVVNDSTLQPFLNSSFSMVACVELLTICNFFSSLRILSTRGNKIGKVVDFSSCSNHCWMWFQELNKCYGVVPHDPQFDCFAKMFVSHVFWRVVVL